MCSSIPNDRSPQPTSMTTMAVVLVTVYNAQLLDLQQSRFGDKLVHL